jgi:hypothetical protein
LLKLNENQFKSILAKPVLLNGQVLWYANYQNSFSRLSDFDEQTQVDIKYKYWSVRQILQQEIEKLAQSNDIEKQNWGSLLNDVFDEDSNVILTDGTDWCLLWGWKFRNMKENYLPPEFMPSYAPAISSSQLTSGGTGASTESSQARIGHITDPNKVRVFGGQTTQSLSVRPSIWDRIKRFLRTIVYRFWGLFFLIMLILFLMCLFKTCSNRRMEERCKELEKNNRSLLELQKKVQEKCTEIRR